jgi:hypothetical protein
MKRTPVDRLDPEIFRLAAEAVDTGDYWFKYSCNAIHFLNVSDRMCPIGLPTQSLFYEDLQDHTSFYGHMISPYLGRPVMASDFSLEADEDEVREHRVLALLLAAEVCREPWVAAFRENLS